MASIASGAALDINLAPRVEMTVESPAASRVAHPALFERVVRRRTHDLAALGVALALVSALLALGVWMTRDVAEGLAIAQYCDGKCIPADTEPASIASGQR